MYLYFKFSLILCPSLYAHINNYFSDMNTVTSALFFPFS